MEKIKKLDEFISMSSPNPTTKPTTTPAPTRPAPSPSPIRRTAPSVAPKPKAEVDELVDYFVDLLRSNVGVFNMDLKKLRKRYAAQ